MINDKGQLKINLRQNVMTEHQGADLDQLREKMQEIHRSVLSLAEHHRDDSIALLVLLRALESLHRAIRAEIFQDSLPNTRHELYNLLRDIEETGGWPYIERMRLKALLERWQREESNEG